MRENAAPEHFSGVAERGKDSRAAAGEGEEGGMGRGWTALVKGKVIRRFHDSIHNSGAKSQAGRARGHIRR